MFKNLKKKWKFLKIKKFKYYEVIHSYKNGGETHIFKTKKQRHFLTDLKVIKSLGLCIKETDVIFDDIGNIDYNKSDQFLYPYECLEIREIKNIPKI